MEEQGITATGSKSQHERLSGRMEKQGITATGIRVQHEWISGWREKDVLANFWYSAAKIAEAGCTVISVMLYKLPV